MDHARTPAERLQEAGVLDPEHCDDDHIQHINANLSHDDVDALIRVHQNVGPIGGGGDHPTGRAWLV